MRYGCDPVDGCPRPVDRDLAEDSQVDLIPKITGLATHSDSRNPDRAIAAFADIEVTLWNRAMLPLVLMFVQDPSPHQVPFASFSAIWLVIVRFA